MQSECLVGGVGPAVEELNSPEELETFLRAHPEHSCLDVWRSDTAHRPGREAVNDDPWMVVFRSAHGLALSHLNPNGAGYCIALSHRPVPPGTEDGRVEVLDEDRGDTYSFHVSNFLPVADVVRALTEYSQAEVLPTAIEWTLM